MAVTNPNYNDYQWDYQTNPVQQSLSTGLGQMLGYNQGTGQFDTSKGSLLGGPGNAFSQQDMSGISSQARQTIGANNKATMAGAGQASAARGTGGPNLASIMATQLGSQNNAALAATGLNAKMQGLNMGLNQYNARAGMAGTMGSLAGAEEARNLERQQTDRSILEDRRVGEIKLAADQLAAAKQRRQSLMEQYLVPGTQKGGFEEGEKLRDSIRREIDRLDAQIEAGEAQLSQFQSRVQDPWQAGLNTSGKWWYDDNGYQAKAYDLNPATRATEADKLYTNARNFSDDAKDDLLSQLLGQVRGNPTGELPNLPDWLVGDQREKFDKDYQKKAKKEREKALKAQQAQSSGRV
jgi:hypothetical protein